MILKKPFLLWVGMALLFGVVSLSPSLSAQQEDSLNPKHLPPIGAYEAYKLGFQRFAEQVWLPLLKKLEKEVSVQTLCREEDKKSKRAPKDLNRVRIFNAVARAIGEVSSAFVGYGPSEYILLGCINDKNGSTNSKSNLKIPNLMTCINKTFVKEKVTKDVIDARLSTEAATHYIEELLRNKEVQKCPMNRLLKSNG